MKIYLLGDSFTDNLFKIELNHDKNNEKRENQIRDYVDLLRSQNLSDPMYFEDYLKMWGHEVINLGKGGCSNYSIYHQFTQIKEPFDRIIVNWTGLSRFEWYEKNSKVRTFTGGMSPNLKLTTIDELLIEQGINRHESSILINETIDFISYFVKTYEKQKPIIWSPFSTVADIIKNQKGFIWDIKEPIFKTIIPEGNKLEIIDETNRKINDKHYGRYGNFYTALVFNTILEHTKDIEHDGYYIKDLDLISKIKEKIKTTPHNIQKLYKNFL
jgi:hypothetical protein